jgi:hypothetical protein
MAERMLKFVGTPQAMPDKRKAEEQASRCSQCGVPYCQSHCPLHNNIPDWLRLTAEGGCEEAYELSNRPPTPSPRSAAASARRTGCAKAIASSNFPAMAPSPSARSRNTSPIPPGRKAG